MMKIAEVFADRNEIIEREATKEELAQLKKDIDENNAKKAELEKLALKKIEILEKLGLNEEELKIILS